jgi:hypothetical protein
MINVPMNAILILKDFSADKNSAKRNRIQPIDVPILLNRRTLLRPKVSDPLPKIGDPISWKAG